MSLKVEIDLIVLEVKLARRVRLSMVRKYARKVTNKDRSLLIYENGRGKARTTSPVASAQ